ncbi:MAG: protein kinase [bacterium]|nr:protein kinase [bacterium]
MSEDGTLIGNRFKLGKVIGMGGMATVYSGIDTQTNEKIAIKHLKRDIILQDPDIVARFDREGEALRRLNHPNIVKVFTTATENDEHYVIMEYVSGGDLNGLIHDHRSQNTPIPIQRILEIALDLSDALTRAHRLKIIHRDIKPANVLLAEDGTPRLTDFGVAHFSDSTKMTQTGALIGTIAYLSPEACSGDTVDGRADIWSFGVMLYELLTLRRPFDENNTAAIITAILNKNPPDIMTLRPDTPPSLVYLLQQMLAKDPDDRIASARLVGAQLEAIISGGNTWDMPITDFEVNLDDMADFSVATPSSAHISEYKVPPSVDHGEFVPDSAIKTPTPPPSTSTPPSLVAIPTKKGNSRLLIGLIGIIALVIMGVFVLLANNNQPSTPSINSLSSQQLETVADNELMVIVSKFDNIGGDGRDVGQFIYEDLQTKFERDVPFSQIRVRLYPDIIRTNEQAQQIALANNAPIIIWGNYDAQGVNVQIQTGSLSPFKHFILSLDEVRRITDVQLQLNNERRESVAPNVLGILNMLQTYDNNAYEIGRNLAILELVNTGETAQVVGNSVAAQWHRYFMLYNTDEETALQEINEAISLSSGLDALYSARALTYIRLGQFDSMLQDIGTVQSLGNEAYLGDDMLLAQYYFWFGQDPDLKETQRLLEKITTAINDNWWSSTMLGMVYWQQGDLEKARTTLEYAITLSPDANYPHVILISIYMRQGELVKAQEMVRFVRQNSPNATIANRIMNSTFDMDGVELTYATEVFGYFVLEQWSSVLDVMEKANFSDSFADVYLLAGLAHCNLRDYEQAEASYTRLLEIYPNYLLGYLLRAEVRLKQEKAAEALADIGVIIQSDLSQTFAPLITGAQNGTISCETILDIDFSNFEGAG